MRQYLGRTALFVFLPFAALLTGCGSNGPSLLVVKNVNGTYNFTQSGFSTQPLMFTGKFSSGMPVQNMGEGYYSPVTASVAPSIGVDMSSCAGKAIALTGKITNPEENDVMINMTGSVGGGTMTLDGKLAANPNLGSILQVTMKVDGGSCPMSSTGTVAIRQ